MTEFISREVEGKKGTEEDAENTQLSWKINCFLCQCVTAKMTVSCSHQNLLNMDVKFMVDLEQHIVQVVFGNLNWTPQMLLVLLVQSIVENNYVVTCIHCKNGFFINSILDTYLGIDAGNVVEKVCISPYNNVVTGGIEF